MSNGYLYLTAIQNSFLVALGEFGTLGINEYRAVDWIIFMLCCLLNLTLMLNLLIAIIGSAYDRITKNEAEISYKEKAILVVSMQDTLKNFKKVDVDHNERLFVAKVIISDDINEQSLINDKIHELREEVIAKIETVSD